LTLNYLGGVSPQKIFAEHREAGAMLAAGSDTQTTTRTRATTGGKINIGYVSGDYRNHPVAVFVEPVFANHDRENFVVHAYGNSPIQDVMTTRLMGLVDHWRDISALDDSQCAALIQRDGIDILVDLSGHTGLNRLSLFARKPVPVQVTWLGYLNTTGLAAMDYRLCDSRTDPEGEADQFHTEKLWRLPDSQWCYRASEGLPSPATETPMLGNGFPTFGSFNNFVKISQCTVELWSQLLSAIPKATLRIMGVPPGRAGKELLTRFERCGISADRLTMLPRLDYVDYFSAFNAVDIALDTVPYNGGTTTCDALWMGTPVIGMAGDTSVSRSAISILAHAGLNELIAKDAADYIAIHQRLVDDPSQLNHYLATLRDKFSQSPMMDAPRFTRGLEQAFQQMLKGAWVSNVLAT
ncbi:MAG: hypothetical protein ABI905_14425, partial [Betaproteobacteria bacterium]